MTIPLRPGTTPEIIDGVRVWFDASTADDADRLEIDAYRTTAEGRTPNAGRELFDDLLHKANFIKTFRDVYPRLGIKPSHRVLELGAGQGWASTLVKRWCPTVYVVTADLAPEALGFCRHYETMLEAFVDEKWAFDVRAMPFADCQFDRVFCFAAFHHFGRAGDYRPALVECLRVLKPGGRLVMLYEPSAPVWLYRRAHRRVNRRLQQDGVPEDVLVVSRLNAVANNLGGRLTVEAYPQPLFREGVNQTLYYSVLARLPRAGRLLVSTVNITVERMAV